MLVRVRLFAGARQLAGRPIWDVELTENAVVSELKTQLAQACPALAGLLALARVAANNEYVDDDFALSNDMDLAIIPPVSGGLI